MKIAVILLNYNSSKDCDKCISFLLRQTGVTPEIIVVDNQSTDEDAARADEICKANHCTFLQTDTNRGYSAGNNVGLRYAVSKGYEYALIANPDMEFPQPDYLARLIEPLNEDRDIVAVGSDIVGADGIHQNPMGAEGNWTSSFDWIKGFVNRKKHTDKYAFIDNYQQSHYCHKLGGCCLMLRLDFMRSIGYFDEYPFLYCEEAIFSKQVGLHHKKMYYLSDVQAVHRHIRSEKGDPVRRFREWRRSRIYFIEKYSGYEFGGRFVAKCSIRLYITIMITICRLRTILARLR